MVPGVALKRKVVRRNFSDHLVGVVVIEAMPAQSCAIEVVDVVARVREDPVDPRGGCGLAVLDEIGLPRHQHHPWMIMNCRWLTYCSITTAAVYRFLASSRTVCSPGGMVATDFTRCGDCLALTLGEVPNWRAFPSVIDESM